jgi:tetratricopeptide (TPR) repeat protein
MSLLLAFAAPLLLAQVGPFTAPGERPVSPLPPELRDRSPRKPATTQPPAPVASGASAVAKACPAMDDAEDAADAANAWLAQAKGAERASAGECLGIALSAGGQWSEAAAAFAAAHEAAGTPQWRGRLSAMTGEAALNANDPAAALAAFDAARSETTGDSVMTAAIAIFRARALVALKREPDAVVALAEARAAAPGNAQAWLLSATLSRRLGKLADAQAQIQRAAELLPIEPQIGLEAGVIAVLSGRDEAARKSWQSVIAAAPQSDAAATARTYLGQLGSAAAGAMIGR